MNINLRPSGIDGLGDMSWGTHFCLFYESKQDLLDFFIPFFKAGLEHNELCLCVASEPLIAEEAEQAMRQALPDFEHYLARGQIEITSHTDWYLKEGHFDERRVLQGWINKLDQALAKGFSGVRFAANVLLEKSDWEKFARYEGKLEETLRDLQIEGLCAYNLNRYSAANILDIVHHHQFTFARRDGAWETLEGLQLKRTHEEVLKLNNELEQRVVERTAFLTIINEQLRAEIVERKRVEEALRESEEKFSAAFRASPIALVIATLDGKFVEMNQAYCDLLGYSREELIGKTGIELGVFTREARQEWVDTAERSRGVITNRELSFRLRNGLSRTTLASVEKITFHGVPHFLSTVLDITERKRAEEALRESEELYRFLAENTNDLITLYDLKGKRVYVSPSITRVLGWLPTEVHGGVHPDDLQASKDMWQRVMKGEKTFHIYRHADGDGSWRWLEAWGSLVHYQGRPHVMTVTRDITERKQTEDEFRSQKEILQQIFDHTPVMIGTIGADGRWQMINQAWEHTLGWTLEELQQPDFDVLAEVYPDPRERQRVLDFIAAKSGRWEEFKARAQDGHMLDVTFTNVYLSDGTTLGFGLDVTERKRAEEALRKSERVLREAEVLGHTGSWEQNLVTGEIFNTEENLRLFFGDDRSQGDDFEDYAQVVHPDDREYVMRRRAELVEEGGPSDIEYRVVWPDGSIHVIFGRATVVRNELGQPIRVYGTNVDITDRKNAEEEIRRYATRMEALAEISQALAEVSLDVQAVFETIVRHTAELIGDTCGIRLLSSDEQWLQSVAFHNPNPEVKALMGLLHPTTPTLANHSWLTPVLRTGQPMLIPVITQEQFRRSVQPEYLPFFEQVGLHSLLIVPLRVKGRVIGTLGLSRDNPGHPYTLDDQVLLQDLADRASLTIQSAQLFEQVEGAREQLGALSRRLLEVQESERRALTTELHDRVGQNLTGLSINLQNMKALLSDEAAKTLAVNFDEAQALVEDTTRQVRDIMAELHPPELEDYGLAAALETYAERAASLGNLELIMELPDLARPPLPSDVRIALFRVAQEAISNVLRHAGATQLEVNLQRENGKVRLKVEDNGRGFDPNWTSQKEAPSWGLQIMRERIESIGGKVQIESKPGEGTRVTFEIERQP
jgi:PAS domain S-box-containing protein